MKNTIFVLVTCTFIFFRTITVYSQPTAAEVDQATREVDRSLSDEAEKQMRTFPKKPKITVEGEDGQEEDLEEAERSGGPTDKKLVVGGCSGVHIE